MLTKPIDRIPLFEGFSSEQMELLDPIFLPYECFTGTVLFEQGEPAEYLYLVISGEVVIRYNPDDGDPINIARVRPGGLVGWSAVIGRDAYTSSAACQDNTRLLRLSADSLQLLCERYPETGLLLLDRLAKVVAERLESTHPQVFSLLKDSMRKGQDTPGVKKMEITASESSAPVEERIQALLEQVSAYIEHYHGGSVEMVSFDGDVLKVKLGGACLGCPLLPSTLHGWVEGTVRQFFPEVEKVESITD